MEMYLSEDRIFPKKELALFAGVELRRLQPYDDAEGYLVGPAYSEAVWGPKVWQNLAADMTEHLLRRLGSGAGLSCILGYRIHINRGLDVNLPALIEGAKRENLIPHLFPDLPWGKTAHHFAALNDVMVCARVAAAHRGINELPWQSERIRYALDSPQEIAGLWELETQKASNEMRWYLKEIGHA